jgi:hypothetical protein
MRKLIKLISKILQGDFEYICDAISWRTPDWIFYYFHTFLARTDSPKLFFRKFKGCSAKFISEHDIELLERNGFSRSLTESRLEAGDRGVIFFIGDELLSIIWACHAEKYLKVSGIDFNPGAKGIFLYGGYTKESVRLRGFHPVAMSELINAYFSNGRSEAYATISALNAHSIKLHERMNFKIIGECFYITFLGLNFRYDKNWPHSTSRFRIFLRKNKKNLPWV